ncbi:hypothetical protein IKG38_00910 [Candidatus Saccharibacteria bacterium]|nr:hypothetical protein [Candidatus Saccharibacteria bacterium]
MSAEELLVKNEEKAISGDDFIANVYGRNTKIEGKKLSGWKSLGVMGFLTAIIVVFAILFSSGNIIPSAISERLVEETDVQYADAVASKELVFQQALFNGEIPEDTAEILKRKGVLVGYLKDDKFVESNKNNGALSLKIDNKIIAASDFISEVESNLKLYEAFNEATYSRAAYYYDEAAQDVFKKIGTTRNNYNNDDDFDSVMENVLGEGSNIDVNTVVLVEKTRKNEQTGKTETYYEYEERGNNAVSDSESLAFINAVGEKNTAGTSTEATLNSADALKVADTMSKEQRSSLFYLTFMENISKMKAGEGNDSKLNDAMNFIYLYNENEVVDVKTGEVIKVSGSPMDSPSLAAILAGNQVDINDVQNYSSERILKLTENKLGVEKNNDTLNTVASSALGIKGKVGRFINNGDEGVNYEILGFSEPIINNSLVNNSYKTVNGINAGEMLVEGAINVGKELAKKSGGAAGDAAAVVAYSKLNNTVIARDAEIDRKNRSPFDITSRNTFLGSLVYNLAFSLNKKGGQGIMSQMSGLLTTTGNSIAQLMPTSYADATESFLTNFGECETYGAIGAVGSAGCSEIATFDTTTLNDPFNDEGFISFINSNTTLSDSGKRTINDNSVLANYILYNNERITPVGVMDGGIIDSLNNDSSVINMSPSVLDMIKSFLGTSDNSKRIASGAAFVNSSNNPDWQTYKYAQRYVSLARATENLNRFAGESTAYNNILYFEGDENPVMAFLNNYYKMANR